MSELVYPDAPGFKVSGPSEQAAETMGSTANKMRAAVLAQFAQYPGGATADEVARDLKLSILSVRPRVSELKRLGEIKKTGARRKNQSGMTATVWRLSPREDLAKSSDAEFASKGAVTAQLRASDIRHRFDSEEVPHDAT
jgi:predicted ArsR family transcriptional regulator